MHGYGNQLRALRGDKTQAEVAKAIGISASAWTMYETEKRIPRDSIKMAIANYFNTSVEDIFFSKNATNSDTI